MTRPVVGVRRLPHHAGLPLPSRQTAGASGYDVASAEPDFTLAPLERRLVRTGLALAIPAGYEAQVRPRSGLAVRNGISVLNTPGTIDADYRGEIQVILVNFGAEPFLVTRGLRIAQLVVAPVNRVAWREESELENTTRGGGGFGSTGLKTGGLETAAKQTVKQRGGR